jgi:UDP-N-acetylglucosamine diphosphorylase / glucose-1-phosphate thymidylyltransferase / UDP-N-acetylgalactosamine diphosphorylase / glucosamine-1-phosphate N-acetyltransferase / galactosamine-1-phosphate N-acetyltransferase
MRCHLLDTGTRIEPFLDPIGEAPVANRPLAEWQRRVAASCGLELVQGGGEAEGPCLVMADDLFVTRGLMRAFLAGIEGAPTDRPCVLLVEASAQLRQSAALQGLDLQLDDDDERASARFPLWYLPKGVRGPPPDLVACHPISVRPREKILRIPVPEHWFGRPEMLLPLTKQAALRLQHWSHLLAANRLAWALDWLELPRWRLWLLGLGILLRAVVPTRARLLRASSRIGRGCEIHPTAVIEGSILGAGVKVGPFAVVRFSRLGAGTWVQDHGKVTLSVLGDKTLVSAGSTVNFCVSYPEASASQILMQLSVLGRRCVTTGGGFMMDMRFDGEVRVMHRGEVHPAGSRFLGSAIGHDVILGTGFWLAPGRAIPNGAVVVRDPDDVVRRVPGRVEPGTVLVPRGGALVPLAPSPDLPEGDEPA